MDLTRERKFLYHESCPDGKQFYMEDAQEMIDQGWLPRPLKWYVENGQNIPEKKEEKKEEPEEKPGKKLSRDEMKKLLDKRGVKYFPNAKDVTLEKLVKESDDSSEDN